MSRRSTKRIHVLMNPRSGLGQSLGRIISAFEKEFARDAVELSYQVSRDIADGRAKAGRVLDAGVDTLIVVGGDGMVNTIGTVLIGSDVALGVVPAGSGNGFARHFGIPLSLERAVRVLRKADRKRIDVGVVDEHPFFVTCSMAADAVMVKYFERSPIRGIVPYLFGAAQTFFDYVPQPVRLTVDNRETLVFEDPMLLTAANLTQYGGGARIAPQACPDDGALELIVATKRDIPAMLPGLPRLFNGTVAQLPGLVMRRFQKLDVRRRKPAPIQVDGELINAGASLTVRVRRKALTVLVPRAGHESG
ncbi:MAG TPA: diacylglycerol kinase family protein [Kiritimatiellia bacterium]